MVGLLLSQRSDRDFSTSTLYPLRSTARSTAVSSGIGVLTPTVVSQPLQAPQASTKSQGQTGGGGAGLARKKGRGGLVRKRSADQANLTDTNPAPSKLPSKQSPTAVSGGESVVGKSSATKVSASVAPTIAPVESKASAVPVPVTGLTKAISTTVSRDSLPSNNPNNPSPVVTKPIKSQAKSKAKPAAPVVVTSPTAPVSSESSVSSSRGAGEAPEPPKKKLKPSVTTSSPIPVVTVSTPSTATIPSSRPTQPAVAKIGLKSNVSVDVKSGTESHIESERAVKDDVKDSIKEGVEVDVDVEMHDVSSVVTSQNRTKPDTPNIPNNSNNPVHKKTTPPSPALKNIKNKNTEAIPVVKDTIAVTPVLKNKVVTPPSSTKPSKLPPKLTNPGLSDSTGSVTSATSIKRKHVSVAKTVTKMASLASSAPSLVNKANTAGSPCHRGATTGGSANGSTGSFGGAGAGVLNPQSQPFKASATTATSLTGIKKISINTGVKMGQNNNIKILKNKAEITTKKQVKPKPSSTTTATAVKKAAKVVKKSPIPTPIPIPIPSSVPTEMALVTPCAEEDAPGGGQGDDVTEGGGGDGGDGGFSMASLQQLIVSARPSNLASNISAASNASKAKPSPRPSPKGGVVKTKPTPKTTTTTSGQPVRMSSDSLSAAAATFVPANPKPKAKAMSKVKKTSVSGLTDIPCGPTKTPVKTVGLSSAGEPKPQVAPLAKSVISTSVNNAKSKPLKPLAAVKRVLSTNGHGQPIREPAASRVSSSVSAAALRKSLGLGSDTKPSNNLKKNPKKKVVGLAGQPTRPAARVSVKTPLVGASIAISSLSPSVPVSATSTNSATSTLKRRVSLTSSVTPGITGQVKLTEPKKEGKATIAAMASASLSAEDDALSRLRAAMKNRPLRRAKAKSKTV